VVEAKWEPVSSRFPGVTLGRPVAIPDEPAAPRTVIFDQQLRPVAFNVERPDALVPLARAQASDSFQPLPAGPASESDTQPPPKPKRPPTDTLERLGPPRLMPSQNTSNKSATEVIADDGCGLSSDPCGDGESCCGVSSWWPRWFCLLPNLWRPGECVNEPYDLWVSGEYLLWWIRNSNVPPLVTTSPIGTPRAMAGVLGAPGTTVLFGDSLNNEERSGGRLTLGFWCDDEQTCGLEGSGFFLAQRSVRFNASSPGAPILARPFFDIVAGQEASELVAFPGVLAGTVAVSSSSRLFGAELNARTNWWRGCCWRFDTLLGFRYVGLDERLSVNESLAVPMGAAIAVNDRFGTENNFYGGQLGGDLELRQGPWSLNLVGKVALGSMRETVNINGSTTFFVPGSAPSVQLGGLLAQPTNIGQFARDRFAVVPEVGVKLGYQATQHLRLTLGYTFLYLSDVARPGSQIDRAINVTQLASQFGPGTLVGPARPAIIPRETDFWAQGISFGLEFTW
jgi:hypothetical protein